MFRSNRSLSLLLATSLLVATTACHDDNGTAPVQHGTVRVVHAIGNGPALDVLVDGQALTGYTNVAFKANGAYQNVAVGARDFVLRQNGTQTALLTLNDQQVAANAGYTLVALGRAGAAAGTAFAPTLRLIPNATIPAGGQATLRLLHASPAAGNVDVYITAPNADLAAEQPDFANVAFNGNPVSTGLAPGTYRIRITAAGTKTVKIDKNDIVLAAGQRWLAIALGDDAPGTGAQSAFDVLLRQEN